MAINYAEKYSSKVDERFTKESLTDRAVNKDYDFVGVNAVNVYSIETSALNDYSMSGSGRYGTPTELGDTKQTLTLGQDKAFTFTIDKRNADSTMGAKEDGKALRRQIDEVVTPEIDKYRLGVMVSKAGNTKTETITKENAYTSFLDGVTALLDEKVTMAGAVSYIGSNFYKQIRLDSSFIKASDMAQDMLAKGVVGQCEGVTLVHVPSTILPAGVEFIITNKIAVTSPIKLSEYKVHDNPPGINGKLVEGRILYDAFVLNNKAKAIYVQKETAEVQG